MECSICCDTINEYTGHCELACKHTFHIICLTRWTSKTKQSCPLCRRILSRTEKIWWWKTEEESHHRDPLREPAEEQRMMWEAVRLFEEPYWTIEGPNPDICGRRKWRRRRYQSKNKSRGWHTHTNFITDD